MIPNVRTTRFEPFGLQLDAEKEDATLADLDIAALRELVLEFRVLVLRGFAPMDRETFERYAAGWGEILQWNFGAILDVVVDPDPRNYLFTNGSVPHHWDGAFAETVPFLQIFQCLEAPGSSSDYDMVPAGGETVFCDTTRVWDVASLEQRAIWEQTQITYLTEKLSHYGGRIEAPLVAHHPLTHETTLRFAEPANTETAPLNPVSMEVRGSTEADLMRELQPLLYADETCYVHDWQEGDYVIADNHALLHARKAFAPGASRHLQRIHIK